MPSHHLQMTLPLTPFRIRLHFPCRRLPACSCSATPPATPLFYQSFLALDPWFCLPFFASLLLSLWIMMHFPLLPSCFLISGPAQDQRSQKASTSTITQETPASDQHPPLWLRLLPSAWLWSTHYVWEKYAAKITFCHDRNIFTQ